MAKKYILLGQLSIAYKLLDFVNNELLPGTGVTKENFWNGLDKCAHELAPKNRKLLEFRENLQKKIDIWHIDKNGEKIDIKKYLNFLVEIGYLKILLTCLEIDIFRKMKRYSQGLLNLKVDQF